MNKKNKQTSTQSPKKTQHSYPPPQQPSGNNNGIIALFIGGLLVLGLAVFILTKRSKPTHVKKEAAKVQEVFTPPAPLVVEKQEQPLAALTVDTETSIEEPEDSTKAKKATTPSQPVKMGTIDATEVNRFIDSRFAAVRSCYEKSLKTNPMLQGSLDLRITLSPKGKATSVGVNKDTVRDSPMLECVRSTIQSWQFPIPDGGRVVFDKPFQFKKLP